MHDAADGSRQTSSHSGSDGTARPGSRKTRLRRADSRALPRCSTSARSRAGWTNGGATPIELPCGRDPARPVPAQHVSRAARGHSRPIRCALDGGPHHRSSTAGTSRRRPRTSARSPTCRLSIANRSQTRRRLLRLIEGNADSQWAAPGTGRDHLGASAASRIATPSSGAQARPRRPSSSSSPAQDSESGNRAFAGGS